MPDCGLSVLPGRLAALTHPLNAGRTIVLPDREWYDPDCCVVVSSGVSCYRPGDVVVLAPNHGAFVPNASPDGREMRLVGVVKPWWESVLGVLTPEGFSPGPGWCLIDRKKRSTGTLLTSKEEYCGVGALIEDGFDHYDDGTEVFYDDRDIKFTFLDTFPESWALMRSQKVSRRQLRGLERSSGTLTPTTACV